jgi:hypothetical protein
VNGFVYIIGPDDGVSPVKIGFSASPLERLRALQTGNHAELQILGIFRGSMGDEQTLHQRCSEQRLVGEWFKREGIVAGLVIGGLMSLRGSDMPLPEPVNLPYSREVLEELVAEVGSRIGIDMAERELAKRMAEGGDDWEQVLP